MEPLTHFLTGACMGRAGLNRKTAYATLAAVLAAEAADIDIFWSFAGPVEELKRHRGITHTLIGAPFVAGAVVGGIWLWHFWRERRRRGLANAPDENAKGPPGSGPPSAPARQAIRWGWLYLTALIAALSHLLLDWTNNYGVRPFFPFNPRWYAGSIVFIAEPVLWALLFLALVLPWLFGLTDGEIGARRKPFRGRGWAIFALAGMVVLWCWRWAEQAQARATLENMQVTSAPATRMTFEPYPVNPCRWHAILETADYYQTAEINTRTGESAIGSAARHDLQTARYPGRGSRQTHGPGPGLPRLGNMGSGARPGPGAGAGCAATGTATRPHVDHGRVQRSALCLFLSIDPRRGGTNAAEWMGLHRGRSRRSGPGNGRTGAKVTGNVPHLLPMETFVGPVERFG